MRNLEVEVEVTITKTLDLERLIINEYIDEDTLVEALSNNDHETINRLFGDINVRGSSEFYDEVMSSFKEVDTSKKSVSIKYNGQELKSNML